MKETILTTQFIYVTMGIPWGYFIKLFKFLYDDKTCLKPYK